MICIPKEQAEILKRAFAEKRVTFADISQSGHAERVALFEKIVPRETAQYISTQFEIAVGTRRASAVKAWANKTFSGKEVVSQDKKEAEKTKTVNKDIIDKINELSGKANVLEAVQINGVVDEIVAKKLGMELTMDEVAMIDKLARELEVLSKQEVGPYKNPPIEYFVKRDELEKYLQSINPQTPLAVFFGTIAPGNLLMSLKSPFLNIVSSVSGGVEAIAMRLANRIAKEKLIGDPNDRESAASIKSFDNEITKLIDELKSKPATDESTRDYKKIYEYAANAAKVYAKSGIDIARVTNIGSDQKVLGEERQTAQGEGATRAVGRFSEQVVFRYGMGTPDAFFAGLHVADSVLLSAKQMADMYNLQGAKRQQFIDYIFYNTLGVNTVGQSDMLQAIKMKGIAHALYATYQNDSKAADIFLDIRKKIDEWTGDIKMGKFLAPFVKTPVNVIGIGLSYAGGGLFTGGYDLMKYRKTKNPAYLYTAANKAVRAGLGLLFSASVAFGLMDDDDEYVPAYGAASTAERALARDTGASYDSVRIGDKYVSLAYFGPLAPSLAMFLSMKKAMKEKSSATFAKSFQGATYGLASLPFVDFVKSTVENVGTNIPESSSDGEKVAQYALSVIDQLIARTIPAISSDVAQATDSTARKASYDFVEGSADAIQKRIPGLSQFVDPRIDTFGNEVPGREGFVDSMMQMFGGARLRTRNDDPVIQALETEFYDGVKTSLITTKLFDQSAIKKYIEANGEEDNEAIADVVGDRLYADIAYVLLDELPEGVKANVTLELQKAKKEYAKTEDAEEKGDILNSVRTKAINKGIEELKKQKIIIKPKKEN